MHRPPLHPPWRPFRSQTTTHRRDPKVCLSDDLLGTQQRDLYFPRRATLGTGRIRVALQVRFPLVHRVRSSFVRIPGEGGEGCGLKG